MKNIFSFVLSLLILSLFYSPAFAISDTLNLDNDLSCNEISIWLIDDLAIELRENKTILDYAHQKILDNLLNSDDDDDDTRLRKEIEEAREAVERVKQELEEIQESREIKACFAWEKFYEDCISGRRNIDDILSRADYYYKHYDGLTEEEVQDRVCELLRILERYDEANERYKRAILNFAVSVSLRLKLQILRFIREAMAN